MNSSVAAKQCTLQLLAKNGPLFLNKPLNTKTTSRTMKPSLAFNSLGYYFDE